MSHQQYVPVLKWKQGEQKALANLDAGLKPSVFPIAEVLPETVLGKAPGAAPPSGAFQKIITNCLSSWGSLPIAFEMGLLPLAMKAPGNLHPVTHFFALARQHGLTAVPVTGIGRDPAFTAAIAGVVAQDGRGVVLRLTPGDLFAPTLAADLRAAVAGVGAVAPAVDLVLDWGYITPQHHQSIAVAVQGVLAALPPGPWRSVTFAAGSFPQTLQVVGVGTGTLSRAEWLVWQQLRGHAAGSTVRFGDYGITHPVYNSVPISGSANIRYTHTNDWLIARGRKVTGAAYGGFGQFVALSKTVVGDTRFCGTQYSWGDDYVSQCSAGTVSTGNMTTWRAVGTNHHITFVVRQLATSAAASAAPAPPPVVGPTAATPPADGP